MIDYNNVLFFYCSSDHSFIVIMSQEDILQSTKTVIQGLDALKNEHGKMLDNILDTSRSSTVDKNKIEEKASLLRKSMDMIELGKIFFQQNIHLNSSICFFFSRHRRSSSNDSTWKSSTKSRSRKT